MKNIKLNKNIKLIPFPGIENAYIVISGSASDNGNGVRKHMTFFYANGDIAVDWEPEYGPISILYKCTKDHPDAQPHWYYDYVTGYGHWAQQAVNREGLPDAFLSGDYTRLFEVLKAWSDQ